jgi:H+/Cl- antiporter ClcA
MNAHDVERSSTTAGLPISPGLGPALEQAHILKHPNVLDNRTLFIVGLSVVLALATTVVARALIFLVGLITNLAFYARLSGELSSPSNNTLGYWVILVPVIGAGIVGVMARYGSKAIRGHGIPEAMEQVLTNESRIPLRMTFLKPLSAAIAIGTGGPFGAEGPIIGTGGALGSLLGQLIHVTAHERKSLLAAGAAAGMTAIFGTPFSAILLAIELLLFEFRPRSFIPVAFAALTATCLRPLLFGSAPLFHVPDLAPASESTLLAYSLEGIVLGLCAVIISKSIYYVEDLFEHLPIHWMWWPALGGVVVGAIGVYSPHTMGIGYENIEQILSGKFVGPTLMAFCAFKFISWSVALGSGTSGGTLAPLFTIGGGIGVLTGQLLNIVAPSMGCDLRMAALVGMASCFAGASRAMLASVVFALEITQQFNSLLPLLAGCTAAFTVSALLMKNTIMTEKLVRRGHHVPSEYLAHDTRS